MAGGDGSIIPRPVSSVPKLTSMPSSDSGGGGGVNPKTISNTNAATWITIVPAIPFFLSEGNL
jgi:hypothetical protein